MAAFEFGGDERVGSARLDVGLLPFDVTESRSSHDRFTASFRVKGGVARSWESGYRRGSSSENFAAPRR